MSYEQSETIGELAKALVVFHKEIGTVSKDADNSLYRNKYATLSNILFTIKEPLQKAKLAVTQLPIGENSLITVLMHESGEWIRSTYSMIPVEQKVDKATGRTAVTPQSIGIGITYMRRYALGAVLSLNIDEDDDGNSASGHTQNPTLTHSAPQSSAQDFHKQLAEAKANVKYSDLVEGENETTFDLITEGSYDGKVYLTVKTPLGDVRAWSSDTDPEFIHQVASLEGQLVRFLCGKSAKGSLYIKQIL